MAAAIRFKTLEAAVKGMTDENKRLVDAAYKRGMNEARAKYRDIVKQWETEVDFAVLPARYPDAYLYQLKAFGEGAQIFVYVDKGTEPHEIRPKKLGGVLAFQSGYSARTAPIAAYNVGTGKSSGAMQYRQKVDHPGTKARQFTETIMAETLIKIQQYIRETLKK